MTTKYNDGLRAFDLTGRNILVTGGGYGLGKTMARGLAAAGARVAVAGRTEDKLLTTVAEIEDAGGSRCQACLLYTSPSPRDA